MPLAFLTTIASPIVSSTAKSLNVTPLLVTNKPSAPDFWFLKDKIVLSKPSPDKVTLSISRDSPSSIS